jgi:hypothetical protein
MIVERRVKTDGTVWVTLADGRVMLEDEYDETLPQRGPDGRFTSDEEEIAGG